MWVPQHKHPLFDKKEKEKYQQRWLNSQTSSENAYFKRVLSLIEGGAGKHLLNQDFYRGQLPILENDLDLKGFKLWNLKKDFSGSGDTFKGLDFSYTEGWHSEIKNAIFYSCTLSFSRFYNCTFQKCAFAFTHLVGAKFEKCKFIDCDFGEPCTWENSTFINTKFNGCFLGETSPFVECYFDDLTSVESMHPHSFHFGSKVSTSKAALSGYYASFQDAYQAAGAEEKAMECYWKGRKAFTRYNLSGLKRITSLGNELIAGYGVRPLRPLAALFIVYVSAVIGFSSTMPPTESIIFSAGALLTFGAAADHLREFGYLGRLIYVSVSFAGLILSALFVTVLANRWFRSRIPNRTIKTNYSSLGMD